MRVLVFGGTGMLGGAVVKAARRLGMAALGVSHSQADITDAGRVTTLVEAFAPQLVVNAAAFTAVDRCESEPERALAVNGTAVGHVRDAARAAAARLVHVSSDYVFDGSGTAPYREDAAVGPLSVYGATKLAGEQQALADPTALVVRTSWVFGHGSASFPATMRRFLREGRVPLRVVADQTGCPTYAPFLAAAILDLASARAVGVVHYANREAVSWYDFAREIVRLGETAAEVLPIPTAEMPRPARRPMYSVLATERAEALLGRRVEPWTAGLVDFMNEERAIP
jgi:dTDP-4-dehydrorhamnose reductase